MALAPEFFVLLGIATFLGMSVITSLLNEHFPSWLKYLFQAAGLIGLLQLFMVDAFSGTFFRRDPSDPVRFWVSVAYLSAAVASVAGLNIYLGLVKRKFTLAATFTGSVTVPAGMVSIFFIYSYVTTGGDVVFNLATAIIIAVSALVSGFSVLGFLRQALRTAMTVSFDGSGTKLDTFSQPASGTPNPSNDSLASSTGSVHTIGNFSFQLPSTTSKDGWEEAGSGRQKEESQDPK